VTGITVMFFKLLLMHIKVTVVALFRLDGFEFAYTYFFLPVKLYKLRFALYMALFTFSLTVFALQLESLVVG
jgi:hypothetical protein